jgi:hypothetical protein
MKSRGAPIQPATKLPLEVFGKWTLRGERYCRELLADTLASRGRRFELSTPVWIDICRELSKGGLDTQQKVSAAADRVLALHRERIAKENASQPSPFDLKDEPWADLEITTLPESWENFDISDLIPEGDPFQTPAKDPICRP